MVNFSSELTSVPAIAKVVPAMIARGRSQGRTLWMALAALAMAGALSACAGGPLPQSSLMPSGTVSSTLPAGYSEFCGRHPELCRLPEKAPAQSLVSLTPEMEKILDSVNLRINRTVVPAADTGRAAYWEPADRGDCKTYSVRKMQALLDVGVPRQAMHVATVRTPDAQGHAVLTIDTDRGTYVLDNMSDQVKPWQALPYTYWSREAAPGHWDFPALDGKGRVVATERAQS